MSRGSFSLILHAHLPYVRHPEYEVFLEEQWLFEAMTETYLPLLAACERLLVDEVPLCFNLSVSPTLATMLRDELLQSRYRARLAQLRELAAAEVVRTRGDVALGPVARFYAERLDEVVSTYERYGGDIVRGFCRLRDEGGVELMTTAATHAFLPLHQLTPEVVRAQLKVAAASHASMFGRPAEGLWLPECGYFTGLEDLVAEAGFRYFVVESHGLLHASVRPKFGTLAPIVCDNGVAAFGRDPESSRQVWSRAEGYPGDPWYREFHRDIGFELDPDYLGLFQTQQYHNHTGFKYHRITGSEDKQPYHRYEAMCRVRAHARDFVEQRKAAVRRATTSMSLPPHWVAPYDAELFGHWWFEGPEWLEEVLRRLALEPMVEVVTLGVQLGRYTKLQRCTPSASSWGEKGYNEYWLNERNDWLYPQLHSAARTLSQLVSKTGSIPADHRAALAQACRELLLAQASDWPFIMKSGTSVAYAEQRSRDHLARFQWLVKQLESGEIDARKLRAIETLDCVFPEIDPSVFASVPLQA